MQPMIVACCSRRPAIRRGRNEGERSGQTGLMQSRLLLTQHLFAVAAMIVWRCRKFHQSRRSGGSATPDLILTFRRTMQELTCRGTFLPLIYFVSLDRSATILVSADARVEPIYLRFEHRCWHRTLRRGLCHRVCQSPSRRAQPLYYRENRLNSNAVLASSPRRSVHLAGGLRPVSYLPQTKAGHPEGTPFQS